LVCEFRVSSNLCPGWFRAAGAAGAAGAVVAARELGSARRGTTAGRARLATLTTAAGTVASGTAAAISVSVTISAGKPAAGRYAAIGRARRTTRLTVATRTNAIWAPISPLRADAGARRPGLVHSARAITTACNLGDTGCGPAIGRTRPATLNAGALTITTWTADSALSAEVCVRRPGFVGASRAIAAARNLADASCGRAIRRARAATPTAGTLTITTCAADRALAAEVCARRPGLDDVSSRAIAAARNLAVAARGTAIRRARPATLTAGANAASGGPAPALVRRPVTILPSCSTASRAAPARALAETLERGGVRADAVATFSVAALPIADVIALRIAVSRPHERIVSSAALSRTSLRPRGIPSTRSAIGLVVSLAGKSRP